MRPSISRRVVSVSSGFTVPDLATFISLSFASDNTPEIGFHQFDVHDDSMKTTIGKDAKRGIGGSTRSLR